MKLLRALALSVLVSAAAFAQNAALMPYPRLQFLSPSGVPLAGGQIFTCSAGTSCPGNPLASYTDSTAATPNTNPIVLDSGGFAPANGIWLGGANYKIVAEDVNSVVQWTVDNVSIPAFGLITGAGSLSSLSITGNASIGGTLTVAGSTTLAALSAATGAFSGNVTVGGTLGVTGATTLAAATVGGTLGVTGTATFAGNETIAGTLSVAGATSLPGGISGATAITGATTVTGTLGTTDNVTVGGTTLAFTNGASEHVATGALNSDLSGFLHLSAGTATYTFAATYATNPICVATDTSALNPVKATASTTVLTITGTASDTVDYVCLAQN